MKKDIMKMICFEEREARTYRLNNISFLRCWNYDALGNHVDKLQICFDNINGVCFPYNQMDIKSRDYDGIIKECSEITERFLKNVNDKLVNDLRAGYNNTSK